MAEGKRELLSSFHDMDKHLVFEGDKVIVAIYTGGFVIGEVVKGGISAVFDTGRSRWGQHKVKVEILKSSPPKYNTTMTYDIPERRMLKLPDGFLD